ncbi:MAG: DUF4276 family protein [Gammaproteobacteria bacterium]|nr:DUF4276 family protein [Gammaproteobacteria bacterium]
MRNISMFVEDHAHYEFFKALLQRLAREYGLEIQLDWQNVRRGHGKVIRELRQYLRDLYRGKSGWPDLVIVATDANCKGLRERLREVTDVTNRAEARIVCAIPDPHIERWLLLDSSAFKHVFGRGCDAPDQKCERARYKKQLTECIVKAGIIPNFGGIEYMNEIVQAMDLDRAGRADTSLATLLSDLHAVFQEWRQ